MSYPMQLWKQSMLLSIQTVLLSTALMVSNIALAAFSSSGVSGNMETPVPGNNSKIAAINIVPSPPDLNVKAYALLDYDSGQVLAEKNMNERLPPASLTKLMTAYIVENMLQSNRIKADDKVRISKKAWQTGGSTMFLEVGETTTVLELLKGLIVVSGNDAAVALSEYIAGSEEGFVQIMNATARQMKLANTHFVDANGLPDQEHYSSAYDLALISWHIIHDHPQYYPYYAIREFQHGVDKRTGSALAPQPNRLSLLWTNPDADGLKTGHTQEAGYCLSASIKKDDRRLIAVVLNAPSSSRRDIEAQKLLTYGYRFFTSVNVAGTEVLKTVPVWKGTKNTLTVGVNDPVWVTVPKGDGSKVQSEVIMNASLDTPIVKGQQVGELKVMLNGEALKSTPVIARENIDRAGFFKRLWDSILMFFKNLF